VSSADFWTLVILGLVLKVPLLALFGALWYAVRIHDSGPREVGAGPEHLALCAYCGTCITIGYDSAAIHDRAERISARTGEATFDVEARLVRGEIGGPNHFAVPPAFCPSCGEEGAWARIQPIDLSRHPVATVPPGDG
jgi:hypothetical protein